VTGAASGIGRAIALSLAKRGCNLALADVNEAGLSQSVEMLNMSHVRVSRHVLNVADREAVAEFPARVAEHHEGVDVLVNNAGVALGGRFEQVSEDDFDWLFEINFYGVVRMTRAFLPVLRRSEQGRIVNLSSVFGLVAPAGNVAYASSKFAVRGFSEALRHELAGSNVGVTVVHPGGVATEISNNARVPAGIAPEDVARKKAAMNKNLRMPPQQAGEIIVRGIERDAARVLVGGDAIALSWLSRLMPVSYRKLLSRGMK
jgi:short-subunit dehydrogenase